MQFFATSSTRQDSLTFHNRHLTEEKKSFASSSGKQTENTPGPLEPMQVVSYFRGRVQVHEPIRRPLHSQAMYVHNRHCSKLECLYKACI
jgi:hypothetical protein